ncbi:2-C-methyl-D-erythritol 4-phosphate cytidylyltransferase [Bacteroidia bacterium]|nr:2-C-methyl-D-erythritol 4-phosphate cytidylyltransferase [Bacteroidia bacterium]
MNIVAILAAGNSSRMKMDIPKQFALIDGEQTVLELCISKFQENKHIDKIIVVIQKKYLKEVETQYQPKFSKFTAVIEGGEQRFHSSLNAITFAAANFTDEDNLWLHDAARPFVSNDLIDAISDELLTKPSVVPVLPLRDSIYEISDQNEVLDIPNRECFVAAQTPQAARLSVWKKIINALDCMSIKNFTDDMSMLFYSTNTKIFTIKGTPENRKITFSGDM